ncbi:unnamed protein product [Cyprideis torosa]|uniref:Metalloendopeptidase n=1 Tax=Cyprideis torosa TaxID=163714 RepID=A0A7R8ZJ85_9CRUS|nr:unnamed protein product [Cyprideis torosa]CAG0888034.1 unnamed protein product [Cyprideis torosa]
MSEQSSATTWPLEMVSSACSSYIGRQPLWVIIGQPVFLGFGCLNTKGTAIHELLHAVGFFHEQSRPDRDAYVRIQWWNILPWNWSQFTKRWTINSLGSPYDYDSVMHYGNRAFSWNGFKTIVARDDPNRVLGQRDGFSESDIEQVNNLYGC